MNEKLQLLLHLYGEVDDQEEREQLLANESLQKEWDELQHVKQSLDEKRQASPSSDAIENVLAFAEKQSATRRREEAAHDRVAVTRPPEQRRRSRLLTWSGAVATLMVVLGIGFWVLMPSESEIRIPEAPSTEQSQSVAPAPGEEAAPVLTGARADEEEVIPSWDEFDDLRSLRYHLRVLETRSPEEQWFDPTDQQWDVESGATPGSAMYQTTSRDLP